LSDLNTKNDDNAAWLKYYSQWHPTVYRIMDGLQQARIATAPANHFTGNNEHEISTKAMSIFILYLFRVYPGWNQEIAKREMNE